MFCRLNIWHKYKRDVKESLIVWMYVLLMLGV